MSEHTPGPWMIRAGSPLTVTSGPRAEDVYICTVSGAESNPGSQADARLIAAAPDLLAALKTARLLIENGDFSNGVVEYGRDEGWAATAPLIAEIDVAIAKAEGRP